LVIIAFNNDSTVDVGVGVGVWVGVVVGVFVGIGVDVGVGSGVTDGIGVDVGVGNGVDVLVGVGVGNGISGPIGLSFCDFFWENVVWYTFTPLIVWPGTISKDPLAILPLRFLKSKPIHIIIF